MMISAMIMIMMERRLAEGLDIDSPQNRHRSASSSLIGLWQCGQRRSMRTF